MIENCNENNQPLNKNIDINKIWVFCHRIIKKCFIALLHISSIRGIMMTSYEY